MTKLLLAAVLGFAAGALNSHFSPPPLVVQLSAPPAIDPDFLVMPGQIAAEILHQTIAEEAEEVRRQNNLLPDLSDRQFVDVVYQVFYGRHAFTDGKDGESWVDWLNFGKTRGWVAWHQLGSAEFRERAKNGKLTGQ